MGILLLTRLGQVDTSNGGDGMMLAISEVIILTFIGLITLVSIPEFPWQFDWISTYFGFLQKYISRGILYLILGIHGYPIVGVVTMTDEDLLTVVFRILCCVCIVCGALLIIIGCGAITPEEQRLREEEVQRNKVNNKPSENINNPNPIGNTSDGKEIPPPFPTGHPMSI